MDPPAHKNLEVKRVLVTINIELGTDYTWAGVYGEVNSAGHG